jgi:hypothetical protein
MSPLLCLQNLPLVFLSSFSIVSSVDFREVRDVLFYKMRSLSDLDRREEAEMRDRGRAGARGMMNNSDVCGSPARADPAGENLARL